MHVESVTPKPEPLPETIYNHHRLATFYVLLPIVGGYGDWTCELLVAVNVPPLKDSKCISGTLPFAIDLQLCASLCKSLP